MGKEVRVSQFIKKLGEMTETMPDNRAGRHNQIYDLQDAVRGAFSVFYMQSASFLAHQRALLKQNGRSNLESVFQMKGVPSDTHIRSLLDGIPTDHFEAAYTWLWQRLAAARKVAPFQVMDRRLLVGVDGIQFFSSANIHCGQCSCQESC